MLYSSRSAERVATSSSHLANLACRLIDFLTRTCAPHFVVSAMHIEALAWNGGTGHHTKRGIISGVEAPQIA